MDTYCLNCGHVVKEKYCPNCSQNIKVGPISWKSLSSEFVHNLTHAERSLFGTSVQLVRTPQKVLDEYLSGKRKKYHPPVGFFLIWVTLSIITHRLIIHLSGFHPVLLEGLTFGDSKSIHAFITHGEIFYLITFPLSAALFYFILAKPLYSYIESLVITMYAFSVTYMFFVICYLIGGGLLSLNVLHWKFYLFQILLSLIYILWMSIELFRRKKLKFFWLRLFIYTVVNLVVVLRFLEFLSRSWVQIQHYYFS